MTAQSDKIDKRKLLELWRLRCLRATKAHYSTATEQKRLDALLTALNVIAAITLVSAGSAYWVINAKSETLNEIIAVGAVINVILSVIQYIFDFRTRASEHKRAASDYAILNREIEVALTLDVSDEEMKDIQFDIDVLGYASPVVSGRVWRSANEWTVRIDKLELELFPSDGRGAD